MGRPSLARNFLTICLSLYIVAAFGLTLVESWLVSAQVHEDTVNQSDALAETFGPPLTLALWDFDDAQRQLLLKTLAAVPSIGRVKIQLQTGQTYQVSIPTSLGPPRVYPLVYDQFGQRQTLGTLTLEASTEVLDRRVTATFWLATVRTAILLGLLSLILVLVVRRVIGLPLQNLALQVSNLDPSGGIRRSLVLGSRTGAELTLVSEAFNELLGQFRTTIEDLHSQQAQLRTLLDTLPDLVWLKDSAGVYLACNRKFERFFGASEAQIRGRTDFDFVEPSQAASFRAHDLKAVEAGKPSRNEEEIVFADDGHREHIETIKTPIYGGDGSLIGVLGIGRDITERIQAEWEREKLLVQLKQSQKIESLGTLASGLSHEMNNVLAVISGMASVQIRTAEPGSAALRAFETIHRAADRGGKLVKSLLSFARQSPVEEREVSLNDLLREEQALFDRVTATRVAFKLELAPDLGTIKGDPNALVSAILNLCGNAVDAMPDGGTLTIRTRNADLGRVELEVQDTGTGMEPAVLKKALDPFFTTKAVGQGTGLGLPFVYSTVRSHQGEMEIRSEVGLGTTIRVSFPSVEPSARPEPLPPPGASPIDPIEVLLVDDDELVRESACELLKLLGHHTVVAPSGEEALAMLEGGLNPDLVILDMNMPGLGGRGALPRLRALKPTLPVLLASGQVDQATLDFSAHNELVWLLAKPYSLEELQDKIILSQR